MNTKLIGIVGLAVLLIVIGVKAVEFVLEEHGLGANYADAAARLEKAQAQEASLKDEVQYLADPANLEKELRARFNYKKPGETMIVIVPPASSTPTSTAY